nr:MAG TPA: hypothetical protein [Caudoviricetes sp.]
MIIYLGVHVFLIWIFKLIFRSLLSLRVPNGAGYREIGGF